MNRIKRLLSDKSERNVIINIFSAFAIKGFSMFISLFSMPMYIKYFSEDSVLGLWYTILSILSWINICDLGLGNGMRNRLTEAISLNDYKRGQKYISSTYIMTAIVILPVVVVGIIVFKIIDLNAFFNISQSIVSKKTLFVTITILLVGIGSNFLFKIVAYAIYAIQKSSINNFLALISNALPLLYVAVFNGNNVEENLINLSVVHVISINLPLIVATIILFAGKLLRAYRPSFKAFDLVTAKGMLGFGLQFFFAQIFFMVLMSTNELFITKLFSPEDVVEYSIYYRIFHFIGTIFSLALTPLWSKVTKDLAEKNYRKIKITNRVLYAFSGLAILVEFAMIVVLQPVVKLWLGEASIKTNTYIGLAFAWFGSIYVINIVLTTVANGMGNLKSQIIIYGIGAALKIPSIILFANMFDNWITVVLYNSVVLTVFSIFQLFWVEKTINGLIKSKENKMGG